MSLILCKLTLDVVIEADGKTVEENGRLAKQFASDELDHIALSQLPRNWHDSLPYRDPSVGPELTCRQILAAKVMP